MSRTLPTSCRKYECSTEIGGYDHVCPNQHLQYMIGRTPIILLLLSALIAIHLFHLSGNIWPIYLLAAIGFLSSFAIAFSRGGALGPLSIYISLIVIVWLLWEIMEWSTLQKFRLTEMLIENRDRIQENPAPWIVFVLVANTVLMFFLVDMTALTGLHKTARLYLAIGAFILGFWWSWGLLIQLNVIPAWFVQASLIATLVSPLVVIIVQSGSTPPLDSKLLNVTFWITISFGYLQVVRPLIDLFSYFVREVFPRLVGQPPLREFDEFWVLKYADLMSQVSVLLLATAMLSLVAASITRAVDRFQGRVPSWYTDSKNRSSQTKGGVLSLLRAPAEMILALAYLVSNLSLMIMEFFKCLVLNIVDLFWQTPRFALQLFRELVVPVVVFSAVGLGFLVVLRDLQIYIATLLGSNDAVLAAGNQGSARIGELSDATVLWGQAVSVVFLALAMGVFTFMVASPRFRSEGLASVCVMVLGYLAVTIVGSVIAVSMVFLTRRIDLAFEYEGYGELLRVNATYVVILLGAIVVASIPSLLVGLRNTTVETGFSRASMFLAMLPIVGFIAYALILGAGPLYQGMSGALGVG